MNILNNDLSANGYDVGAEKSCHRKSVELSKRVLTAHILHPCYLVAFFIQCFEKLLILLVRFALQTENFIHLFANFNISCLLSRLFMWPKNVVQ